MEKKEGGKIYNSTLRRKTGFRRSPFLQSKPPKDKGLYKHGKMAKPRMRQASKKRQAQLTKNYYPAQEKFLRLTENRFCWICISRSLNATREEVRKIMLMPYDQSSRLLQAAGAVCTPASEVHHVHGRIGRLLEFEPYFLASCLGCREWPHVHSREARRLGLLASATEYNVFPRGRDLEIWEEYRKNSSSFETKMK